MGLELRGTPGDGATLEVEGHWVQTLKEDVRTRCAPLSTLLPASFPAVGQLTWS